ncbi:MAG: hypothetical protein MHM6MM_000539 [Cercozoa sp. M6MM]
MAIDEEQRQTEASAGGPPRLSFAETREERRVPRIVTSLTRRIRELDGFRAEGIFRLSAGADDLAQLRTQLVGGDYRIERAKGGNDPIVPAAMLKEWLRGLREPLIPFSQYDFCIERAKNKDLTAGRILKLMAKLPESNRALLEYLIKMLQEASQEEYVVTSKMTLPNLAIVFSPSFLRSPNDDPALAIMNTKFETEFVIALVKNCTYSSTG